MRREGFTLVEVMMALGVMTIGAMSLIAMQQQATRANVRARDVTVATQIAQNVIERLKLESLGWTTWTGAPASDLSNCTLLAQVTTASNVFMTLPTRTSTVGENTRVLSNAFDYAGMDVSLADEANASQVRYCASYRLTWVYNDFRSLRADVRVWWAKEAPTREIMQDFSLCKDDGAALSPGGARYDDYHVVYLSTVLRPGAG